MPRFYCATPLASDTSLELPPGATRHVQVLRLQPGDSITLFDGQSDNEFDATVTRMGRSDVQVQVGQARTAAREPARRIHLAVGMPANDRMDWLVEKATELGVASIQPLMTERSVLKLKGERADKKLAHWQGVAVAAAEQCGRNRVPVIHPAVTLPQWLVRPTVDAERWVLSLAPGTQALGAVNTGTRPVVVLSGPEGGLAPTEEAAALAAGFQPVTLGPRVLRAETAPLAVLSVLTLV